MGILDGKIEKAREKAQGQSTEERIKQMKEEAKEEYYICYSLKDLFPNAKMNTNIFDVDKDIRTVVSDRKNVLTIRYTLPKEEGRPQRKENLVIATSTRSVQDEKSRIELADYFLRAKEFVAKNVNIQPAKYIANLQAMGWEITNEGLDIFARTRTNTPREIKRTMFLKDEKFISDAEKKENTERHYSNYDYYKIEEENLMIHISDYLRDVYTSIPYSDIQKVSDIEQREQLEEKLTKMIRYCTEYDKGITEKSTNLFSQIFTKTKSIKETIEENENKIEQYKQTNGQEDEISVAKKICSVDIETVIKPIKEAIQCLPEEYRDSEREAPIWSYLRLRTEVGIQQANLSVRGKRVKIEDKKESIYGKLDEAIEMKRQMERQELEKEVLKEKEDRNITPIGSYKRGKQQNRGSERGIG